MKDNVNGCLWTIAICTAIVGIVFGILGALIGLDFAITISYIAGVIFALSIYIIIILWIFSFNFKENFFIKTVVAGVFLSVINYIVFAIFDWQIFYTLFVVSACITAIAVVIGLIKTIFGSC